MLHSVSTATPLRISFAGGGSDISSYFSHAPGAVVGMAIRQYVYVTVKRHSPLFGDRFRISYSKTESVGSIEEIENEIVKSCLTFLDIDEPLQVITSADLPYQSGLGSSSSFCVGLLRALHELGGDLVSAGQIAEEACEVEINMMGKPIGKQDQYAAAFGGLNYFEFRADNSVILENLPVKRNTVDTISNLFLLWTGVSRLADSVLSEQKSRAKGNFPAIHKLADSAEKMRTVIRSDEMTSQWLGHELSKGWEIKRTLADAIETAELTAFVNELSEFGSIGHKVSGAGGGGFIVGVAGEQAYSKMLRQFGPAKLMRPGFSPQGSWIVGRID